MAIRLGSGEYESIDVALRQSTIEARYKFFQTLDQKRSDWAYDLLRLFNSDAVSKEFLEKENNDEIIPFFLLYLTSRSPREIEIRPEIIDVPLINYYRYFFDKEEAIKQFENGDDFEEVLDSSELISRRSVALRKIIPSWKDLKTQTDAKELRRSLETWAKHYNLNEDWFFDFALRILHGFKSGFDFKLIESKVTDPNLNTAFFWRINFEWEITDAISRAILDYSDNEVWINKWSGFEDLSKLPAFEYQWGDFKLLPLTWLPRMSSRKGFVEEMHENLYRTVNHIRQLEKVWDYPSDAELNNSLKSCRKGLESYCDEIEKQKSENLIEEAFLPFEFDDSVKVRWLPSKQSREQFIEENIFEFKTRIINMKKAAKSLNTFTKRKFNAKLTYYCNEIEKSLPENLKKTPQKYSENKHFEWLIDFQVTPCKNYTQIAKENKVDVKTVKEAVQKLAKTIGISPRKPRTGRPKGSKDSEMSPRQINNRKN